MHRFNGYVLRRTISGLENINNGMYIYDNYIKQKTQIDTTIYKRMEICPWPPKKYCQKSIDPSSHSKENNHQPSSQKN